MQLTSGYIMSMPQGKQNPSGPFARAISAEVRATMARQFISGAQLATKAGISQSYLSSRLRDVLPFTLNDVEVICKALGEDLEAVLNAAVQAAAEDRQ